MRAVLAIVAALAAAPLAAEDNAADEAEVIAASEAFFAAIGSNDKTALARVMDPAGMIYIHDRMDPSAPEVIVVPVAKHLENWLKSPKGLEERMIYTAVLVDGDMAMAWGPFRFMMNGKTTHCGIDMLSLLKRADSWKVANTSFSMVPPDQCEALGAPGVTTP